MFELIVPIKRVLLKYSSFYSKKEKRLFLFLFVALRKTPMFLHSLIISYELALPNYTNKSFWNGLIKNSPGSVIFLKKCWTLVKDIGRIVRFVCVFLCVMVARWWSYEWRLFRPSLLDNINTYMPSPHFSCRNPETL